MKDLILITGCARSGTSMTAAVIGLCGANGGDMFGPNKYNKKGMFENKTIREGVVKPYLRSIDADPMGQLPLPNMVSVWNSANDEAFVKRWREIVLCSLSSQIQNSDAPWFYKGAKICLTWPIWAKAFPEAKWILVRRNDDAIINSCMRTSFMKAYQSQEGWASWVAQHKKRFAEMRSSIFCMLEVWPEKVFSDNLNEYRNMVAWLGLSLEEAKVQAFIDPHLWRNK